MFLKNASGCAVIGRVVRDPEQKVFGSGKAKTTFSVLYGEDKNQTDENGKAKGLFLNVDSWGAVGRDACLLGKGDYVIATGRIDQHEYNDKVYTSLVADGIWCDMSAMIRLFAEVSAPAETASSNNAPKANPVPADPFSALGGDDGDLPF